VERKHQQRGQDLRHTVRTSLRAINTAAVVYLRLNQDIANTEHQYRISAVQHFTRNV